ncbi:MAG: DegQ family serine endoprotease [Limisphaerales bacterium]
MNSRPNLPWKTRVALLAGVLLLAAGGALQAERAPVKATNPELRLNVPASPAPATDTGMRAGFAPIVEKVAPSVVNIAVSGRAGTDEAPDLSQVPPQLRQFFGARPSMPQPRRQGAGSGVIVTADGYILTNNHVVEGADEIKVALNPDGREYEARVVGRDPETDIAVLKIEADGLSAIQLGDSEKIAVGDIVLAVGNPFGVGQTVTMGIVGGVGRASPGLTLGYQDFIQTDAAINPGNSGGALVDAEGRLLGVNTAILSRTGGNHGIGFAVPVNLARSVMENLVEHGRVVRGFLGVNIQDLTPALAKQFKLEEPRGALVAEVTPDSPADKAGLRSGDVITAIAGRTVKDSQHLKVTVGQTPPDSKVELLYLRDGKEKSANIVLRELPGSPRTAARGAPAADDGGLQGVMVQDLTPADRKRLEIPDNVQGALVGAVKPGTPAAEAGLETGDLIREINRQPVKDAEDAVEATKDLSKEAILLKLWSKGGNRFVVVDETRN